MLVRSLGVQGRFPTLNQYVDAERGNKYRGNKIKRQATEMVAKVASNHPPIDPEHFPLNLRLTWYFGRKGPLPDPDNAAFAIKFVLDGLVEAEMIPDDNRHVISRILHEFEWRADLDGVLIRLYSIPTTKENQ